MGRTLILRHVLPPIADALLRSYKEKVFSLLLKHSTLTFKPSITITPVCLLLTVFYTQYTTNMFLKHFTT